MSAGKLITDHIDLWSATVKAKSTQGRGSSKKHELYGIKKLRELILELAVRGKLVPQDPNDEPASVLLERISAEKAQLIKDKKIKKQKPLLEVNDNELPFDIPKGWEFVRLGRIGNIFNGNSVNARTKEELYTNTEGLPFIATKDVGYGFESLGYFNGVCIPPDEPKFKVAKKGAVLICAEGGSAGKKCGIAEMDVCFGNKLFANELFGGISPVYLLSNFLTKTFYDQFSASMTGIIGGISASKFAELIIPVPPVSEQVRIDLKVEELMALCDQLEQQTETSLDAHNLLVDTLLATLTDAQDAAELSDNWARLAEHFDTLITTDYAVEQLKQTILQLAVQGKLVTQDPNDEPASELLKRIATEKAQLIKDKKLKPTKKASHFKEPIEFDQLPNGWVAADFGDITFNRDAERIPLSVGDRSTRQGAYDYYGASGVIDSIDSYLFDEPLLLIGEDGANLVNRSTPIAFMAHGKYWVNNHAHVVDGISEDFLMYLELYINSISLIPYITGMAQPKMNQAKMNSIFVALPPENEQLRILNKVSDLWTLCDRLKADLQQTQTTQLHIADAVTEQALA